MDWLWLMTALSLKRYCGSSQNKLLHYFPRHRRETVITRLFLLENWSPFHGLGPSQPPTKQFRQALFMLMVMLIKQVKRTWNLWSFMHIYTSPLALFGYQSVTSPLSNDQPDAISMSQGEPWLLALKRGWRSNLNTGNPSNSLTVSTKREHS